MHQTGQTHLPITQDISSTWPKVSEEKYRAESEQLDFGLTAPITTDAKFFHNAPKCIHQDKGLIIVPIHSGYTDINVYLKL